MSLGRSIVAGLWRRYGWSPSRQSWEERLGMAALAGMVGSLVGFGNRLSPGQVLLAWALVLAAAAYWLRRGWLKLFGPVLFYDMVLAARRGRYFLLRGLYAGLLLFIVFANWLEYGLAGNPARRSAVDMAMTFFQTFMAVQFVAVVLLTPAYVAGAVAEEKERKTLEFLLATDLRNREIVLSKLVARLANLTLFLLTGLPILGIIQFLGGIDPNLVLAGFALTGLTMLGIASLSILNSVQFQKPRDAIGMTYLFLVAYLGLATILYLLQDRGAPFLGWPMWDSKFAPTFDDAARVINAGNIVAVLGEFSKGFARGDPNLAAKIGSLVQNYAWFHGVLALLTISRAVLGLRQAALRQTVGVVRRPRRSLRRPPVSELPLLWKEVHVEGGMRPSRLAMLLIFLILLGMFLQSASDKPLRLLLWGAQAPDPADPLVAALVRGQTIEKLNAWVRLASTIVGYLSLLGVAFHAATSISNERARQTWDSLLTSPLSSRELLWSKFLGCLCSMRFGWWFLGLIWGIGLVTGALHVLALQLLIAAWFIYASCFALIGLWFSATASSTRRATVLTGLTTVGLSIGHWLIWLCCGSVVGYVGGDPRLDTEFILKMQTGATPPAVLFLVSFFQPDRGLGREFSEYFAYCLVGLLFWALAARIFAASVLQPRFRELTGRQIE